MLGQTQIRTLLRDALRHCPPVADADIYLTATEQALTRFANNRIHQNVAHRDAVAHIRVAIGQRQGRAATNNLAPDALADAMRQAAEHARLMPEDPHFPGIPEPAPAPFVDACDEPTAACDADRRAALAGIVCRKAAAAGLDAAGFCRTGLTELAVVSTRGADAWHAGTFASLLVTARRDDAAGWAKDGGRRIDAINPETLATEAIGKAIRGRNPQNLPPGDYPVVLEHYAVADLLEALAAYGMGAHMVQDGRSWMNDLIGQPAFSPLVSIRDDGANPAGWPVPFDAEGIPRRRVDIVTNGVVRGPVHNAYTAARAGVPSTGHQRSAGSAPAATNLFMRPGGGNGNDDDGDGTNGAGRRTAAPGNAAGHRTTEQLIAAVPRGLYITRFYYTRLAHSRGCVMTGMTRDGTFLIENGELTTPVKNLRFTQSYVDALAGCRALSAETRLNLNEAAVAITVPAALLENWRITGQTV